VGRPVLKAHEEQDMSDQPSNPVPVPFDLAPGLNEFYSSQAELMLAQFRNIDRLLGRTHDWTHPGDYCEILFRDCLRKFVPPVYSVDKGFFYGRATLEGRDTHSPEIDILVHDTNQYQPLFRMGDFVIVRPQAVRAIIQVKRTLTKPKVRQAINNVVNAKQHLFNVLWDDRVRGWGVRSGAAGPQIFAAVVGFEDNVGNDPAFYHDYLLASHKRCVQYDRPVDQPTSMNVLPAFVGSLRSYFLFMLGAGNYINPQYLWYESIHDQSGTNVSVQAFINKFFQVFLATPDEMPPMAFPTGMRPLNTFRVLQFDKAELNSDGTVSLTRNDTWSATYRKTGTARADANHHFTCDASGKLQPAQLSYTDVAPQQLFVKRGEAVEQFEIIPARPK
jgi:hypothetical protein